LSEVNDADSVRKLALSRLNEWSGQGWKVEKIRDIIETGNENLSNKIIEFEVAIQNSAELKKRIKSIQNNGLIPTDLDSWVEELKDPLSFESINEEYTKWAKQNRSWEISLFNSLDSWLDLDLEQEYDDVLARLDDLDISSHATLRPYYSKLNNPSKLTEIEQMLEMAETSERKQVNTITTAIENLENMGIQTQSVDGLPLIEAIGVVEKLQRFAGISENLKLTIIERIEPFDPKISQLYLDKRKEYLQNDPEKMESMYEEIYAVVDNFHSRLDKMNALLKEWRERGIFFPDKPIIEPGELLHWESNLEKTNDIIEEQLISIERGELFEKLWPDDSARLAELKGNLDRVEDYNLELKKLEESWKEFGLKTNSLIQKWEFYGIDMSRWLERSEQEPRLAFNWLTKQEHILQKVADLIKQLEEMDTSFEGKQLVDQRLNFIRTQDVDLDDLDLLSEWVHSQAKRRARHRILLEKEWRKILRNGSASEILETTNWTLSEFEDNLARAQKGEEIQNTSYSNSIKSTKEVRLRQNMDSQILTWKSQGWNISELEKLANESPKELAKQIIRIREDVADYSKLRRRLSMLPWSKNTDLALEIEQMSSRPEKLSEINSKFSTYVRLLATSAPTTESYDINLFKPKQGRMTLLPVSDTGSKEQKVPVVIEVPIVENSENIDVEKIEAVEENSLVIEEEDSVDEEDVYVTALEEFKDEPVQDLEEEREEKAEVKNLEVKTTSNEISKKSKESLARFLKKIGLQEISSKKDETDFLMAARRGIAGMVGIEPRDTRVDRMLRVALRLIPAGNADDEKRITLLNALTAATENHHKWTKKRLQARREQGTDHYLDDSKKLGVALERIPGPGLYVPLEKDEVELPSIDDLANLSKITLEVAQAMSLPTAGGIR
tara:strand:- start:928 stop:3621 length:2694 start_codon:yes stop_codon:yes gene_type:complete